GNDGIVRAHSLPPKVCGTLGKRLGRQGRRQAWSCGEKIKERPLLQQQPSLVVSHAVGVLSTLHQTPRVSTELHVILRSCFRRYICFGYTKSSFGVRMRRTVGAGKETRLRRRQT
ncbi:hypothetical protein ALC53_01278, partial [Atta colombica]